MMAKQTREQHSKLQKQKEKLLREIKLSETKHRTIQDEIGSAKMTVEKLELKRASLPMDDMYSRGEAEKIRDEKDRLLKDREKQVVFLFRFCFVERKTKTVLDFDF